MNIFSKYMSLINKYLFIYLKEQKWCQDSLILILTLGLLQKVLRVGLCVLPTSQAIIKYETNRLTSVELSVSYTLLCLQDFF